MILLLWVMGALIAYIVMGWLCFLVRMWNRSEDDDHLLHFLISFTEGVLWPMVLYEWLGKKLRQWWES